MPVHFVTVAIEDAPGAMGETAELLSEAGINITAFVVDGAGARFLTTDPDAAVTALNMAGFTSLAIEAIEVRVPNRPGMLALIGNQLGEAGVNILSTFGVAGLDEGRIFLRVDDRGKALEALEHLGAPESGS